jgi:hypothetical protein
MAKHSGMIASKAESSHVRELFNFLPMLHDTYEGGHASGLTFRMFGWVSVREGASLGHSLLMVICGIRDAGRRWHGWHGRGH